MYAIKYDGPRKVQCVEIDKPQAGENEALIKVRSAGICGSDIGAFRGTNGLVTYPVSSVMRWQGKSCPYQSTIKRV